MWIWRDCLPGLLVRRSEATTRWIAFIPLNLTLDEHCMLSLVSIQHKETSMSTEAQPSFYVDIQELPPRDVVCLTCQLDQASGQFSTQIAEGFEHVKRWIEQQSQTGVDHLIIGIPHVAERHLIEYDCCVEAAHIAAPLPHGWQTKQLLGGRYAVLSLEKDSATIGERIGQFFAEYVPQNHLILDATRASYEVYYAQTMDYCVPIK